MMEKAFKQQRETIEKEMADHQERTYMLLQGKPCRPFRALLP